MNSANIPRSKDEGEAFFQGRATVDFWVQVWRIKNCDSSDTAA